MERFGVAVRRYDGVWILLSKHATLAAARKATTSAATITVRLTELGNVIPSFFDEQKGITEPETIFTPLQKVGTVKVKFRPPKNGIKPLQHD